MTFLVFDKGGYNTAFFGSFVYLAVGRGSVWKEDLSCFQGYTPNHVSVFPLYSLYIASCSHFDFFNSSFRFIVASSMCLTINNYTSIWAVGTLNPSRSPDSDGELRLKEQWARLGSDRSRSCQLVKDILAAHFTLS